MEHNKKKERKIKVGLTIASIVLAVAGYNLWSFISETFFYVCQALCFVSLYGVLWYSNRKDYIESNVAQVGFWFAMNNLLDQLFFNPLSYGWNEYLFAAIVVIWQTNKIIKWVKSNKKRLT